MEYVLKLNEIIVGRAELVPSPGDLREARGPFRPAIGYELLEPIFALYAAGERERREGRDGDDALQRFRSAMAALSLHLLDRGGRERPMRDVVIVPADDGALEMRVRITGDGF
jgi:hypothetical protein